MGCVVKNHKIEAFFVCLEWYLTNIQSENMSVAGRLQNRSEQSNEFPRYPRRVFKGKYSS